MRGDWRLCWAQRVMGKLVDLWSTRHKISPGAVLQGHVKEKEKFCETRLKIFRKLVDLGCTVTHPYRPENFFNYNAYMGRSLFGLGQDEGITDSVAYHALRNLGMISYPHSEKSAEVSLVRISCIAEGYRCDFPL